MLAGKIKIGNLEYFLCLKILKSTDNYYLISPVHKDDLFEVSLGGTAKHTVIQDVGALKQYYSNDYLLESIIKYKRTGVVKKVGNVNYLETILDAIYFAKSYVFDKSSISEKTHEVDLGVEHDVFRAADSTLQFEYESENGDYQFLRLNYGSIHLHLSDSPVSINPKGLVYEEVGFQQRKQIMRATIKTITYDTLCDSLDMSWYKNEESGEVVKDYDDVSTVRDFELEIMTPLLKDAQAAAARGEKLDVAIDTETDGLFLYNLDPANGVKNHCVAIPISWREDWGRVIFTDMEHFENISNDYAMSRLALLFDSYKGDREIEYWEPAEAVEASGTASAGIVGAGASEITSFSSQPTVDGSNSSMSGTGGTQCIKKTMRISRDMFNLVGHNAPFDRRVFYSHGYSLWFDDDTLQMSFDIYPTMIKMSHKLKSLTRRVFHCETPELSDVLGKGNEDKYRELRDREVSHIYGCADADFTLKLFKFLRSLMSRTMYVRYRQQDVPLLNILAISEYYGMQTLEDDVRKLAQSTYENIQILKRTMYSYVGAYMDYAQKVSVINAAYDQGVFASEEEYQQALLNVQADPDAVYEFEFKASQLREVLYNLMHYPIPAYTEGKQKLPKVDKYAIDKLLKKKKEPTDEVRQLSRDILCYGCDYAEYNRLKHGTPADVKKADSMVLLSAKEFNSKKYPLALIIKIYSDLNKEYTSYFKPMLENNLEGKMFKGYTMANIETRRISNPGQTMKGSLKALIRAYTDDYYMLDFDMSQVEYRIMLSLAMFIAMIEKMKNPENDYHTETAAMVNAIPPHKVSKKLRKLAKSVSFGVPYGLGERSLCETMFGVVNDETLFSTRMILYKWKQNNAPIMTLLEDARAEALTVLGPDKLSDAVRDFIDAWQRDAETGEYALDDNGNKIPIPMGRVTNKFGFARYFDLTAVDQSDSAKARRSTGKYDAAESSIRRMAGNYPIQSFAAEVFRIILIRFYNRCEQEGINDKIIWHMLIHDELLCSVHKSIHPFLIYKIVKESCMITMPGHTKYFVGINIGDTWAQCKDDDREAPVFFVERMIKRYDAGEFREQTWFDHPWDFIKPLREQYVEDRIGEVLRTVQSDIDSKPIDVPFILQHFGNYTVRAYVNDYPPNFPVNKDDYPAEVYDDLLWASRLESWALRVYGEGKEIIDCFGELRTIVKFVEKLPEQNDTLDDFIDAAELFEDDKFENDRFLDYEEGDAEAVYYSTTQEMDSDEDAEKYAIDYSKSSSAKNLADMIVVEDRYKHLKLLNEQVIVKIQNNKEKELVKACLQGLRGEGKAILFRNAVGQLERFGKLSQSVSLEELDNKIDVCLQKISLVDSVKIDSTEHVRLVNGNLVISVENARHAASLKSSLSGAVDNESGITIIFKNKFGSMEPWRKISRGYNFADLEKLITNWR